MTQNQALPAMSGGWNTIESDAVSIAWVELLEAIVESNLLGCLYILARRLGRERRPIRGADFARRRFPTPAWVKLPLSRPGSA